MRTFIDNNIPMYAAGAEHPAKKRSVRLLERIATGRIQAVSDAEVFQEILHRFRAIGRLADGFRLFDSFLKLIPEILPVTIDDVRNARVIMAENRKLTARDAIHVAVMRRRGIATIYSFDKHFDEVSDIKRIEPS